MKKLRIIIVMIGAPLPFGGAIARWYYVLLTELNKRGHEVVSFVTSNSSQDIEKSQKIFPADKYNINYFLFPRRKGILKKLKTIMRPYSYSFSDEFKKSLEKQCEKGFDILHLEQPWTTYVGEKYLDKAVMNVHHLVSIDQENLVFDGNLREVSTRFLSFKTEKKLIKKQKYIRACSPRLSKAIKKINPSAEIDFVPVGIDSSLYPFITDSNRIQSTPTLTLIGDMRWYPTYSSAVKLLDKLWPSIKNFVPEAKLQIVGFSARERLKKYLDLKDVTIEENVPEIMPYFNRSSVFIYTPEKGSGMKIKILEAMCFGIPVVTTEEGVEGLPVEDGVHALVSENDTELINKTVLLLKDLQLQNKMRYAARKLVENHCSPQNTVNLIENIYKKIVPQDVGENHYEKNMDGNRLRRISRSSHS